MIRAALDTNLLASGVTQLENLQSAAGELLRRWQRGEFDLVITDQILLELERTLKLPYFARDVHGSRKANRMLWQLRLSTEDVDMPAVVPARATHREDDLIVESALRAGARFLVTRDNGPLHLQSVEGMRVISARRFLDLLRSEQSNENEDAA